MRKKYRIVSKRRFYLFVTFIFATISIILFTLLLNSKAYSSIHKINYKEIQVKEGDTLWNIAQKYLPENTDIRKMIFDIKEFNEMDNAYIYPGDIIKIPIENK